MKRGLATLLIFGLLLMGVSPSLAAGQQAKAVPPAPQPAQQEEVVQVVVPEGEVLTEKDLDSTDGQGLVGAILGGLTGAIGAALIYVADAAVGSMTGHYTANAHDFVATVAKGAGAGAAWGAILPEP